MAAAIAPAPEARPAMGAALRAQIEAAIEAALDTAHRLIALLDAEDGDPCLEMEESMDANCAMLDAMDALVLAATAFPILTRPLPSGAADLLAHLRWWLAEETDFAQDYQPACAILQGRAADLAAVLKPPAADDTDPVVAAIVAADMAAVVHSAALVFRDENDEESEAVVDAAATTRDAAFQAVQHAMPATLLGLLTLVRYYGRDCRIYDGCGSGAGYFEHVAAALGLLIARDSTGRFSGPEDCFPLFPQALEAVIPRQVFGGAR